MTSIANLSTHVGRRLVPIVALVALVIAMDPTWSRIASAAPVVQTAPSDAEPPARKPTQLAGKLNLNTATEQQLMMLPRVGPTKAEAVVAWRKKNGGFKRIVDLRRVKGFGYKTFKRLEPYLDIRGETTLAAK
jgi:competence protein ComEA